MRRRALASIALALACASCARAPVEPPPRHFMQGGVWWPAATGYWFHQYAVDDDIERLMADLGFACTKVAAPEGMRLRCDRGLRIRGLVSRTDYAEFAFRRNGALALAESGCGFQLLGSDRLSGTCTQYAARGAVYPDVQAFAAMTDAMLRAVPMGQAVSVSRLPKRDDAPLPDVDAAFDRLFAWRFECESPQRRARSSFQGNVGETRELACNQSSLRTPGAEPQRQQVILRYDTATLAVLDARVSLDGEVASLRPSLATPRDASARARAEPPPLLLETLAGERIEMPYSAIGTGSRQQTREGFASLTDESKRVLVAAYLAKQARETRRTPGAPARIYLGALEWYGPEAVPIAGALADDGEPDVGAAILRYVCFEAPGQAAGGDEDRVSAMTACIDARRATLPRSIATLDRLLASELGKLAGMNARALNAFLDFRRDVEYAIALGPDGQASAAAIDTVVSGKAGLDEAVSRLVARALTPRGTATISR